MAKALLFVKKILFLGSKWAILSSATTNPPNQTKFKIMAQLW